jgi:hypothetical protein
LADHVLETFRRHLDHDAIVPSWVRAEPVEAG